MLCCNLSRIKLLNFRSAFYVSIDGNELNITGRFSTKHFIMRCDKYPKTPVVLIYFTLTSKIHSSLKSTRQYQSNILGVFLVESIPVASRQLNLSTACYPTAAPTIVQWLVYYCTTASSLLFITNMTITQYLVQLLFLFVHYSLLP